MLWAEEAGSINIANEGQEAVCTRCIEGLLTPKLYSKLPPAETKGISWAVVVFGTWSFATDFRAPMKNASFTRGSNWMVCSGLVVFAPDSSSRLPNDLGCRERLVLSFLLVFGCIEVTCQCEGRSGAMQISRKEWTMPPKIDPFLLAEEHLQFVRTCSSLWRLSYNDTLCFILFAYLQR